MSHCFVCYSNWKLVLSEQAWPLVYSVSCILKPEMHLKLGTSWWQLFYIVFTNSFVHLLCLVSTRTHFQTCKLQNVMGVNFILSTTISKVFYSINCSFEMPTSTTVRARVCCWYLGLKRRAKRKRLQRWSSVQLSWRLCLPNLSRQSKPLHQPWPHRARNRHCQAQMCSLGWLEPTKSSSLHTKG